MNIDEAIEFNLDTLQYGAHILDTKCYKALKLGIEALKRFKAMRDYGISNINSLLPGEDSPKTFTLSKDEINRLQESPIGEK